MNLYTMNCTTISIRRHDGPETPTITRTAHCHCTSARRARDHADCLIVCSTYFEMMLHRVPRHRMNGLYAAFMTIIAQAMTDVSESMHQLKKKVEDHFGLFSVSSKDMNFD